MEPISNEHPLFISSIYPEKTFLMSLFRQSSKSFYTTNTAVVVLLGGMFETYVHGNRNLKIPEKLGFLWSLEVATTPGLFNNDIPAIFRKLGVSI